MSSIGNMLLKYLNNLSKDDFKRFKSSLTPNWAEGFDPIPRSSLEEGTQFDVVDLMVDKYGKSHAIKITVQILQQMGRHKPASDLEQEWEDQVKGGKRSRDETDQTVDETENDCTASLEKRARRENVDETDNNPAGFPDLKEISTFAKLERWVSKPEISQRLISDLEGKLGDEGMEALKKEIQDKEPKNSLCFNAGDIDTIRKNKELNNFFKTPQSKNIPKLTLSMFFKKAGSASLGNKAQSSTADDECMDTTADLSSSGYESLLSSSLNDSWSKRSSNYLPQNEEKLPDEDVLTVRSHTGGMDIRIHENKDNGSQSKDTGQLYGESSIQLYHNIKADAPSQELTGMQDTHIDVMEEPSQRSNLPTHEELITKKETPLENVLGSMDRQDTHIGEIDKEPQRSNVPNVLNNGAISLFQNIPITRYETPLEDRCGSANLQDTYDGELDEDPQRSDIPKNGDVYLDKNDPITQKETPLEDRCGPMDMQDAHDEMKSQRSNVPTHEDESITKKETPLENVLGSMDRQDAHIGEIDKEPQRSNVPNVLKNGATSLFQNIPITRYETPLGDRCGSANLQDTYDGELDEDPQRSDIPKNGDVYLDKNDPITQKETPLEDRCGTMDMQDAHEMKSQRSNVPTHEDESITKKETPLENVLGSMDRQDAHIGEIDKEPQRSNVPNVLKNGAISLFQNIPITRSKTPLEDRCGSMDMQDTYDEMKEPPQRSNIPIHVDVSITENETPLENGIGITDMKEMHIDQMDEEPQRSNLPMPAASLPQKESIIKTPGEDRCRNVNMHQNEQANMQVNPEPLSSEQLQKNSSGSAFEYTQSSGTEILAQNKDTAILSPGRDEKVRIKALKKQEALKKRKGKKDEKNKLLREWAERQCNDQEDLQNIREQISIINMAEHTEYPCFTAEKVMVYKYLTPESQIIFIADDNTSVITETKVHYLMFVCNIKKAIVLGPKKPKEQEFQYDESKVPIEKCRKFIVQAFAPALTVYKKIQKESLIWVQ